MPDYRIFETDEFMARIEGLPRNDRALVTKKLRSYVYPQLRAEPHFGANIKKLHGYKPDTWRYRIGKYRIFYCIQSGSVNMITVDHRKDAYS